MKNSVPRKFRLGAKTWAGAALVLLLALQALSLYLSKERLVGVIEREADHYAEVASLKVGEALESARQSLTTLAANPALQGMDHGRIQPLLVRYLAQYDPCGNYGVLQSDGFSFVSALPVDTNFFGPNQPWFKDYQKRKIVVGSYGEDAIAQTEGVVMVIPNSDTNQPLNGVFATVSTAALQRVIKSCLEGEGVIVELFDSAGNIVARNSGVGRFKGKKTENKPEMSPEFRKDELGHKRYFAAVPVPGSADALWVAVGVNAWKVNAKNLAALWVDGGKVVLMSWLAVASLVWYRKAKRVPGSAAASVEAKEEAPASILSSHPEHVSKDGQPGLTPLAQLIIDATGNVVFFTNPQGIFLGCNVVLEQWLGKTKDKIIGKTAAEIFPLELAEHYRDVINSFGSAETQSFESPFGCADGVTREVKVAVSSIHDADSNIIGMMSIMADDTERRNLQRRIQETEDRFRFAVGAAADAIVVMDSLGKIVLWNQAAENLFGYTPDDALGKDAHMLLASPRYHDRWKKHFQQFVETSCDQVIGKRMELDAVKFDGSELPIEVFVGAVKLEDKWHTIGMICDRSGRQVVEVAVPESPAAVGSDLFDDPEAVRGTVEFSRENAQLFADGLLTEMLHVNKKMSEAVGEAESAANLWIKHLNASRASGKPETFAYPQLSKGMTRAMLAMVKVVSTGEGGFKVEFVVRPVDVSNYEGQIKRTHFAMDSSPQGILWADAEGRFTYANASSVSILGYSRDQLMHMSMTDIDHGFTGTWKDHWEEVRLHQTLSFESRIKTRAGNEVSLMLTANYLNIEDTEYVCVFVNDTSKIKSNEDTIAFLTTKLEQLGAAAIDLAPKTEAAAPAEEKLDQELLDQLLRGQGGEGDDKPGPSGAGS